MSGKNSLFNSTLKRWQETNVIFKSNELLDWLDRKPEENGAVTPQSLLKWANDHPYLSVVHTEVPASISGESKLVMHDIKVAPPKMKKGRKVMDDDVYDLFHHIRTYVPRGLTIVEILPANKDEQSAFEIVVYAMKKFTGGPGDEDDEDEEEDDEANAGQGEAGGKAKWEYYFIEPHAATQSIYRTTKENGDSAHLSFFSHLGKTYYLVGSKNVHMLIRNAGDIEKYTDPRFCVAGLIGHAFVNTLDKQMEPQKRDDFIRYMLENKLTATFEFLQVEHQHIELFDFPTSKFRFIAFTYNQRLTELCFNLEEGTKVARKAGWETTEVQKYSFAEQDALFDDIRFHTYGKEGSVLYYVNAEGRAIGMMKKKTIWYILVRAIREKEKALIGSVGARLKKGADVEVDKVLATSNTRVTATMKQKQEWLKLSDKLTAAWTELAHKFIAWTLPKILNNEFDAQTLINTYPIVWNRFLQETNSTDKL